MYPRKPLYVYYAREPEDQRENPEAKPAGHHHCGGARPRAKYYVPVMAYPDEYYEAGQPVDGQGKVKEAFGIPGKQPGAKQGAHPRQKQMYYVMYRPRDGPGDYVGGDGYGGRGGQNPGTRDIPPRKDGAKYPQAGFCSAPGRQGGEYYPGEAAYRHPGQRGAYPQYGHGPHGGHHHQHHQHGPHCKLLIGRDAVSQIMTMMMIALQAAYASDGQEAKRGKAACPKPVQRFLTQHEEMSDYLQTIAQVQESGDSEKKKEATEKAVKFKSMVEELRTCFLVEGGDSKTAGTGPDDEAKASFLRETEQMVQLFDEVAHGAEVEMETPNAREGSIFDSLMLSGGGDITDSIVSNIDMGEMAYGSKKPVKNGAVNISEINHSSITNSTKPENNNDNEAGQQADSSKKDEEILRLKQEYELRLAEMELKHKEGLEEKNKQIQLAYERNEQNRSVAKSDLESYMKSSAYKQELREKDDLIRQLQEQCGNLQERVGIEQPGSGSETSSVLTNTPEIVADNYESLKNKQWKDIKEELDKSAKQITEMDTLIFLCNILMQAEEEAKRYYANKSVDVFEKIQKGTLAPGPQGLALNQSIKNIKSTVTSVSNVKLKDAMKTKKVERPAEIPENVKVAMSDYFRASADTTNISGIKKELENMVLNSDVITTNQGLQSKIKDKLDAFIDSCSRLAWKMVIQNPPMKFDDIEGLGETLKDQTLHTVYEDGKIVAKKIVVPGNGKIQYYVHPVLMHGETIMSKGTVAVA